MHGEFFVQFQLFVKMLRFPDAGEFEILNPVPLHIFRVFVILLNFFDFQLSELFADFVFEQGADFRFPVLPLRFYFQNIEFHIFYFEFRNYCILHFHTFDAFFQVYFGDREIVVVFGVEDFVPLLIVEGPFDML